MLPIPMISKVINQNEADFIYTVGRTSSLQNLRKYDSNGNLLLSKFQGSGTNISAFSVLVDSLNNFYMAGNRAATSVPGDSFTFRKYDSNGNLLWQVDTDRTIRINGLSIDTFDNLYVCVSGASGIKDSLRKYDSNGNLIWNLELDSISVSVNKLNNIYISNTVTGNIDKYDVNGNYISSIIYGFTGVIDGINDITTDNIGNVYMCAGVVNNLTTRKYNNNGNLMWAVNHGDRVECVEVDNKGNVYTGGVLFNNITTRKYDRNGNLIWSVNHGATVFGISIDKAGNVYTVGSRVNNITTRKYDSNGNLIWSVDHGDSVWGVDTFSPNKGVFLS
jgi:hypothetical protein